MFNVFQGHLKQSNNRDNGMCLLFERNIKHIARKADNKKKNETECYWRSRSTYLSIICGWDCPSTYGTELKKKNWLRLCEA